MAGGKRWVWTALAAGLLVLAVQAPAAAGSGGLLGACERAAEASLSPMAHPALAAGPFLAQTELFREPLPGDIYHIPKPKRVDYFSEHFRVGIASGVFIPLITLEAQYDVGWWTRLTFHKEFDFLRMPLFRTIGEVSAEIGQAASNPDDQQWRIVSNFYFFKLRAMADFLPDYTSDLYIFGGVGVGVERARGHILGVTGFDKVKEVNLSPLLEGGGGVSLAVSRQFMLDVRVSTTWPMASSNIILYLNVELGVFFLFM